MPLVKDEISPSEESAPATIGSPGAHTELTQASDLAQGCGAAGYVEIISKILWIQSA